MDVQPSPGVPGRARDLAHLRDAYAGSPGRLIYVAGDAGSGRTSLLRAFAGDLAQLDEPPVVLAGGFADGRFEAWDEDAPPAERVTAIIENVVSLPAAVRPWTELLGGLLARGGAPLELVRTLFDASERLGPMELLPRLLRALRSDGPVVCIVDDADCAPGGLWSDVVLALADAVAQEPPILVVLAVEGPPRLGPHEDGEPDSLYVARRLCGRNLAQWRALAPVALTELAAWTGPADPEVLDRLLAVTGARAAWTALHWKHWREHGVVVEEEESARWTFAEHGRERALDPVDDVLGRRLAQLAAPDADDAGSTDAADAAALELARGVLVLGALEGRRFTAPAVAVALRRDRDEVIDVIDDRLAIDEDEPAGGIVREAGAVGVGDGAGGRHLWLYRFDAELDWLTLLHHHGLGEDERRDAAGRLAAALGTLYGSRIERVAGTVARLLAVAGDNDGDASRGMRRLADGGSDRDVILWRAHRILDGEDPRDRADRRRASQALIAAAGELFATGPFADGMRFAEEAYRLAPLRRDRADAIYLTGVHRINLGDFDEARTQLTHVLALRRELGDREGEVNARHALAIIARRKGAHEQAVREYTRVLEVYRELGDLQGEAATRHSLASIDMERGRHEQALGELGRALELLRELGDRRAEADTRHKMARIDMEQGNLQRARRELTGVLAIYRELGDRHGEADARHNRARIDVEVGALDLARREFTRLLELYQAIDDVHGEAATRHSLASIDIEQGSFERARRELNRILDLGRDLGDADIVAAALQGLDAVDEADAV